LITVLELITFGLNHRILQNCYISGFFKKKTLTFFSKRFTKKSNTFIYFTAFKLFISFKTFDKNNSYDSVNSTPFVRNPIKKMRDRLKFYAADVL
jgi:hypothetical protein